jgi:L-ascorbate metabolism protein UlaG (beta-lactamase superfamily)
MPSDALYLRQNVLVEPLINQWYAWSYLIPPVQAAMYLANLHVKIMSSFIANPQVHMAAVKNPAMVGGPFMNYDRARIPEIQQLLDRTTREQATMLTLADAVRAVDDLLRSSADGHSLEPLYAKIPDALRGYVELVYDLNNQPAVRFFEGLLYKGSYYNRAAQTLALSLIDGDDRPFILSTPLLEDEGRLHLNIAFDDERIAALFKTKETPQPFGAIKEMLGTTADAQLRSLLTEQAPPKVIPYDGDRPRIRYYGHACILMETRQTTILCDPLVSYRYDSEISRYTYSDLPEVIDYALITHNHQDHVILETLLQLRHKIKTLVVPRSTGGGLADPSLKQTLENIGFKNVREIAELETIAFADGSITGLPFLGEHADLDIRTKLAYLVNMQGKAIVCAADSNNIEPRLYERLHEFTGDIDVLFLGMECAGGPLTWLYGPLLTRPLPRKMDQSRRFDGSNYEKAINIVNQLNPSQVYVYAMGQEPWLTHLTSLKYTEQSVQIVESNKLIKACAARGLTAERLYCRKEIVL